ncbi:uncharacterized oxidoreductase SERP2049-like [Colias croceus]|uniref:uncharacterized oxidoreductase SERP2049-like n=1 Tax=Colias crocea TaxID=72248 RepID=UPI001E27A31E|nr:uncharacterized oxidoreductase SERP2049-like [Colias croceus]
MDFANKVVIITGASSGIGAAAALSFAKQSAKLVLVGRNETNLNQTASKCEQFKNIKPLIVKADITVDDDVKNIINQTIQQFGCIDVLVNNAGVGIHGSILEGVELYDKAMNINVRATYLMTSLAAPYLIKSKGNIVNVSSIAALKPIKDFNFLPYCVSKAALDQFTKCVALELASKGVRVNSVNPGCTRTKFIETAGFPVNDEALDRRATEFPLGKIVESDEVADLILYLASDRARSITGSIYIIDNGELLV